MHMEFINFLDKIKNDYSDDCVVRENGTLLLKPQTIPKCKHMFFKRLKNEYLNEYIIPYFEGLSFPNDYKKILEKCNGANLFSIKITKGKFSIAHSMLVLLGLPLTKPFDRPLNMEEPFDIRIENLARHPAIPHDWIKCAIWTEIKNIGKGEPTDIFIDSTSCRVYGCAKNKKDVLYTWENLDECFSSIVKSFESLKDEYII